MSSLTSITIPQPFRLSIPSLINMSSSSALHHITLLPRKWKGKKSHRKYVEKMLATLVTAPATRLHLAASNIESNNRVRWKLRLTFLEAATRLTHLTLHHAQMHHPQWSLCTTHCPHLSHLILIDIQPFGLRSFRAILSIPSIRFLSLQKLHKVSTDAIIILKTSPLVQQLRQLQAQDHLPTSTFPSTDTSSSTSTSTYDIAPNPAHQFIFSILDCEQLTHAGMMATGIFEIMSGTGNQKIKTEYRAIVQNIPVSDEE